MNVLLLLLLVASVGLLLRGFVALSGDSFAVDLNRNKDDDSEGELMYDPLSVYYEDTTFLGNVNNERL